MIRERDRDRERVVRKILRKTTRSKSSHGRARRNRRRDGAAHAVPDGPEADQADGKERQGHRGPFRAGGARRGRVRCVCFLVFVLVFWLYSFILSHLLLFLCLFLSLFGDIKNYVAFLLTYPSDKKTRPVNGKQ